jgi:hypothetical protein
LFAPIPRLYAAGVATLPRRIGAAAFDWINRELGDVIVETMVPSPDHDGYIVVRHEETGAVERALDEISLLSC